MNARLWMAGMAVALAACAPIPQTSATAATVAAGTPAASCNAQEAQFAVAQIGDDYTAEQARKRAGALRVRIVREGQTVTREMDTGRLTLEVGSHDRVLNVYCG